MALKAARFANLFLTEALTGNEFGSWAGLHPALHELPQQAHVRSEQAGNAALRKGNAHFHGGC
jgi:hypothetical protein